MVAQQVLWGGGRGWGRGKVITLGQGATATWWKTKAGDKTRRAHALARTCSWNIVRSSRARHVPFMYGGACAGGEAGGG